MSFLKIMTYTCVVVILVISATSLWYLSPIFHQFPQPRGPYAVGIVTRALRDEKRAEPHVNDVRTRRELIVNIYYPAQGSRTNRTPYLPAQMHAIAQHRARYSWLPALVWHCLLGNVTSFAQHGAPMDGTNAPFPVILFSHGIGAEPFYGSYLEEFASWGYIIVAVYHPYDIPVTAFPDGREIFIDETLRKAIKSMDRSTIYAYRAQAHALWVEDLCFVLDEMTRLNNDKSFSLYHLLDMCRTGVIGHSHGGAVAIDFCKADARCKAGVNMDGWTKTVNTIEGFKKPFLFLCNAGGIDSVERLFEHVESSASKVNVPGAGHMAFSDLIMLKWPLSWWLDMVQGDTEIVRTEITNSVRDFFAVHLN